ncbi:MAG: hypothetical protein JNM40_16030 [Myxococcales bacterium]|nr:hypothetical protein [Myxococcales bacterium]
MRFSDILHAYFRGEATEAWFFIVPAGLLLLAVGGALLWQNRTPFDFGLSIPSLLFGLSLSVIGVTVGARTPSQVQALEAVYQRSPVELANAELLRMEKVTQNFRSTFYAFGALAAVGLLLIYGIRREWATGLGIALIVGAGIGLTVDGVAERRTHPYVDALKSLRAGDQSVEAAR